MRQSCLFDIDDALRTGLLQDIPADLKKALGASHRQRIDTMVKDLIEASAEKIRQGKKESTSKPGAVV